MLFAAHPQRDAELCSTHEETVAQSSDPAQISLFQTYRVEMTDSRLSWEVVHMNWPVIVAVIQMVGIITRVSKVICTL